jgi:hypothetical protein
MRLFVIVMAHARGLFRRNFVLLGAEKRYERDTQIAAILAADIVRYSRLGGTLEDRT